MYIIIMCGIWFYIYKNIVSHDDGKKFNTIQQRGPDYSHLQQIHHMDKVLSIGFHRLSIMDPSDNGNQPFYKDNIYAICNGEIYNFRQLKEEYNIDTISDSDCEVIIPLYQKHGIKKLHELFDGVFAIVLIDLNINKVFVLRDRVGVRGLFMSTDNSSRIGVASEAKSLVDTITPHPPQVITEIDIETLTLTQHRIRIPMTLTATSIDTGEVALSVIKDTLRRLFIDAVEKRMMSDRPVCSLLSGGLDSSIVSSIASKYCQSKNMQLNTYAIGFEANATDLTYAQKVATFIDSNHTQVIISFEEAIDALKDVIYTTETFDVTTVRASTGQYLISKYISENTPHKVVLSGDGSDELMAGYLYLYNAPNAQELNDETLRLVEELYKYDVLRVDRCVSRWGLEARVPFLDKSFVDYFLHLPKEYKQPQYFNIEKGLFRNAFDTGDFLPKDVLFRKKEAFSDGVSSVENSWYSVLQARINLIITDEEYETEKHKYTPPLTSKEAYFYRKIYEGHYHGHQLIDYYWLPKWSDTTEPSARVLNVYK